MGIRISASIFFTLIVFPIYSQDSSDWNYNSKWQVRPSVGVNSPLTKLFNGTITDNLIDYSDNTFNYLQIITATYFFHKHWGVEFNYQGSSSNDISKRYDRFSDLIQNEYEDQYFVTPSSGAEFDSQNIIAGDIERGLIGVIYRKEFKRLLFYPKLAIGVTSFYADWGNAFLKEKDSNTLLRIQYSPSSIPNDHFTIAASLTMGYKLTKRVFVNFDILTSHFKTDFTFTKTTTDLNSGQSSVDKNEYKKDILTLSLGTGLIIVIK